MDANKQVEIDAGSALVLTSVTSTSITATGSLTEKGAAVTIQSTSSDAGPPPHYN